MRNRQCPFASKKVRSHAPSAAVAMRGLDITWRGRCWTGARSENAGGIKSSGGDGGHSGGGGSGFGRGGAERGKCDGGGSGKKLTAAGGGDWRLGAHVGGRTFFTFNLHEYQRR